MYNYILRLLKEINGNLTLAPPSELRGCKRNHESVTNKPTDKQKNSTFVAVMAAGEI